MNFNIYGKTRILNGISRNVDKIVVEYLKIIYKEIHSMKSNYIIIISTQFITQGV